MSAEHAARNPALTEVVQVVIASHTPFMIPESEHSIYSVRCGCTYGADRNGNLPDLSWIDWTAHVATEVVNAIPPAKSEVVA